MPIIITRLILIAKPIAVIKLCASWVRNPGTILNVSHINSFNPYKHPIIIIVVIIIPSSQPMRLRP